MAGVNKVIIVGHLGNDPEVRYTPNGSAVASISVATSESWKDKQTGEQREKTEWHRITLYNRLGEIAKEYLRKSSQVYIEGKLQTNKWQDQAGNDRYTTEIVAKDLQMLGSKNGNGQSGGGNGNRGSNRQQGQRQPQQPQQPQNLHIQDDAEDDIPF